MEALIEEEININCILLDLINIQKQKEDDNDIWKDSPYKDLVRLQSNNVGIVGEMFILSKLEE